ncbi:MAG: flagellar hook protein [Lachnospiraceae bacterium]|nr:flagellar hook protein [Lachnospiraceae bacterium]
MVVQHNLTAMNSNRMLGLTTATQAKSTEKLSSGYKINRAADDAAGLSISEKMRKQIRGLTQASLNAQDGISAVQTAEGALNEVQDMLQRANELAVKAANGTMSETDRNYIQDEIDQLVTEIDRVSTTTKFNETYLLKGDGKTATFEEETTYTVDGVTVTVAANKEIKSGDEVLLGTVAESATKREVASFTEADTDGNFTVTGNVTDSVAAGTYTYNAGGDTYTKAAAYDLYKITTDGTGKISTITAVAEDDLGTAFAAIDAETYVTTGNSITYYAYATAGAATPTGTGGTTLTGATAIAKDAQATYITKTTVAAGWYAEGASSPTALGVTASNMETGDQIVIQAKKELTAATGITGTYTGDISDLEAGDEVKAYMKVVEDAATGNKTVTLEATEPAVDPLLLKLHVGADSTEDNQISVSISSMSSKGLGLLDEDGKLLVNGDNDLNARAAIDTIAEALQQVSTQRSALGAVQNRLEHTINNLDNVVENTTAAEAQIRDTDMATEMVRYSNNNILAQAGQAMLAQANQANQGVLSLLG